MSCANLAFLATRSRDRRCEVLIDPRRRPGAATALRNSQALAIAGGVLLTVSWGLRLSAAPTAA